MEVRTRGHLAQLACNPHGNRATHLRILGTRFDEMRAAQTNFTYRVFRFHKQYAKSNLWALGTSLQAAVRLQRSYRIDHCFICHEFEHARSPSSVSYLD